MYACKDEVKKVKLSIWLIKHHELKTFVLMWIGYISTHSVVSFTIRPLYSREKIYWKWWMGLGGPQSKSECSNTVLLPAIEPLSSSTYPGHNIDCCPAYYACNFRLELKAPRSLRNVGTFLQNRRCYIPNIYCILAWTKQERVRRAMFAFSRKFCS